MFAGMETQQSIFYSMLDQVLERTLLLMAFPLTISTEVPQQLSSEWVEYGCTSRAAEPLHPHPVHRRNALANQVLALEQLRGHILRVPVVQIIRG
jgi:hypothetical protein